ncbi:hypothetical protein K439DRAFT_1409115 [Ramaria rubella]|nr:hypothetical protein K439DRAFT_1409115 [Ramaria rubella]
MDLDAPNQVKPSHEGGNIFISLKWLQTRLAENAGDQLAGTSRDPPESLARTNAIAFEAYKEYKYGTNDSNAIPHESVFQISILGVDSFEAAHTISHDPSHAYLNQTLIKHGLLGTAPTALTLAIPFSVLEIYRCCRLRSPHFSIQQWVKVLCDLSHITYRAIVRDQFSEAFDIYLDILRRLDHVMNVQLGHDGPNWRVLHTCPPCLYHMLNGEVELNPSILGALDGNNSLKRFMKEGWQSDAQIFDSDYFLSQEYVDQFKDEVKCHVRKPDRQVVEEEGDPTDGDTGLATCTDQWQAANADTSKGMYNTFGETGVFVSVCHHRIIWTITDMIRSGEL